MIVRSFCAPAARVLPVTLAVLAAFPFNHAAAQTASVPTLPETVVTATRIQQPLAQVIGDMTLIERDQIEAAGAASVADVLSRQAGIELSRTGGQGATTSLFLRGAPNENTLVMVNGVRIGVQTVAGGTPWEVIPLSQIERIEILRGPAAAVYGAGASAGVVQIFTRKGGDAGSFSPYVGAGIGNQGTFKLEAGVSGTAGEGGKIDYALGVAGARSRGFNAMPGNNPDLDGYKNANASARVGVQVNPQHRVDATLVYSHLDAQYDAFQSKMDDHGISQQTVAGLAWQAQWTPVYKSTLSLSQSWYRYNDVSAYPYWANSNATNLLFQNEFKLNPNSTLTAALEHRSDRLDNSDPISATRQQNALALGYGWQSGPHNLQANLRYDRDSTFGGQPTGGVGYAYAFAPGWKVTGSWGTSFKAPTLYQLYSYYGDANLRPEKGQNVELGLRYEAGNTRFGVVAYQNNLTQMINFGAPGPCASTYGCYANVSQARLTGVTFSGQHRINNFGGGALTLRGSLDFQNPKDLSTGQQLVRRARTHGVLGADYRIDGWTLGGELVASGQRYDGYQNSVTLPGYVLVNLSAQKRLARDWHLIGRIDNLGNQPYQLANGYATPGRQLYLGVKWAPL